jgi:glyoxylase-like metal-dependent hydrolase (beta-lactamase superfamily II)
MQQNVLIEWLTVGPFMTNVYVLGCLNTKQAAIIDAGGNGPELVALAHSRGLEITQILQTHAHVDHVAALPYCKKATDAPIFLHHDDLPLYEAAVQQGMMFGYPVDPLPKVDEWLMDGQEVRVGELTAQVMHLPGHSPGSVAFWFESISTVFSGDVLFAGSMGRVDLPGSNPAAQRRSLLRMRDELPDNTRVLSGHGPETTIGVEKKRNPFIHGDW